MQEIVEVLNRIDTRLATIEALVAKPSLDQIVTKPAYSCKELSELTKNLGVKPYRPFTLRLACKDGRISEAQKLDNGSWAVPRGAVLRIIQEGIPPERRHAI